MNNTTYAFTLSILAGLTTIIGTIPIFIKFKKKNSIILSSLAFAAGVMICVSIIDLIPEAITLFKNTYTNLGSFLFLAIFFVVGIILSMIIDKAFPTTSNEGNSKLYHIGIVSMLAIIMHNLPEGIATFLSANENRSLGLTLAIAIALHNIPEGISISVPIYYSTKSKLKAFIYTLISGLSEPFGALLAFLFLTPFINDFIMASLLAMIAGIMIHISSYELLPESFSYKNKLKTIIFFIIGVIFMYLSTSI